MRDHKVSGLSTVQEKEYSGRVKQGSDHAKKPSYSPGFTLCNGEASRLIIWQILGLKRPERGRGTRAVVGVPHRLTAIMYPSYEGSLTMYIKKRSLTFCAGPSAILRPRSNERLATYYLREEGHKLSSMRRPRPKHSGDATLSRHRIWNSLSMKSLSFVPTGRVTAC